MVYITIITLAIIELCGFLIPNVIVYEVTTGQKFDWSKVLNNKLFIILCVTVVLGILYTIVERFKVRKKKKNSNDMFHKDFVKNGGYDALSNAVISAFCSGEFDKARKLCNLEEVISAKQRI